MLSIPTVQLVDPVSKWQDHVGMVAACAQHGSSPWCASVQAFDAGYHPGSFVGQAIVDIAAMLGEGSLSGHAPLISSSGKPTVSTT